MLQISAMPLRQFNLVYPKIIHDIYTQLEINRQYKKLWICIYMYDQKKHNYIN